MSVESPNLKDFKSHSSEKLIKKIPKVNDQVNEFWTKRADESKMYPSLTSIIDNNDSQN